MNKNLLIRINRKKTKIINLKNKIKMIKNKINYLLIYMICYRIKIRNFN